MDYLRIVGERRRPLEFNEDLLPYHALELPG
jgi:hypothetical protein